MLIRYKNQALSLMIPESQGLTAATFSDLVMLDVKLRETLFPVVQCLIIRHAQ
ncbi:hypothetical protein D3C81_2184660 [compost metagenome]